VNGGLRHASVLDDRQERMQVAKLKAARDKALLIPE
jgi:hypothetical protein